MEQAGEWALPEWMVLAVVREGPTHGFAIAALTASTGELGRVWQLPRPVVYRALSRLAEAGLVAAQRTVLAPIVESIAAERDQRKGFDAVLLTWRHHNVTAALAFLDELDS